MVRVRVTDSKVINNPVRDVYDYLADFGRHGEWDQDAKSFQGPPGAVELGTTFQRVDVCDTVTGGALGTAQIRSTKVIVREVTYLERDRWLEYKITGENGWMHRIEYFGLEPTLEGTRLTKGTDLMYPSLRRNLLWLVALLVPLLWPFVILNLLWLPSIILGIKLGHKEKLGRIRARLEAGQGLNTSGLPNVP